MKVTKVLSFCFLLFSMDTALSSLSCSTKGTTIVYVNGILVNDPGTTSSSMENIKKKIVNYTKDKNITFSSGNKFEYDFVLNNSKGFFNDLEELTNQASRNYTGTSRELYFQEILQRFIREESVTGLGESDVQKLNKLGSEALSFIHKSNKNGVLETKEQHDTKMSLLEKIRVDIKKIRTRIDDLIEVAIADKEVTDSLKNKIIENLNESKKIIIVSHSQGNEVLLTAVNELTENYRVGDPNDIFYKLQRYFGSVQVATPAATLATPISGTDISRSTYITLDKDFVISGAKWFLMDKKYPPLNPNYRMSEYNLEGGWRFFNYIPILGDLIKEFDTTLYHGMDNSYLNDKIKANKINSEGDSKKMSDIFSENVFNVAETLESNCDDFDLTPNNLGSDIVRAGSFTQELTTEISGNLLDGFSDGGLYPKYGNARFKVKLGETFLSSDVLKLERLDTNEVLDPSNVLFNFSRGGDYTIPIRLSRLVNGTVEGTPVEKSVRIHISNRMEAKVAYAECFVHFREDLGYFSQLGSIALWGISQSSPGPIVVNGNSKTSIYDSYPLTYLPQYKWYDAGITNQSSEHIIIEDYSGVIFDQEVVNPCIQGMKFNDVTGLVPVI